VSSREYKEGEEGRRRRGWRMMVTTMMMMMMMMILMMMMMMMMMMMTTMMKYHGESGALQYHDGPSTTAMVQLIARRLPRQPAALV